MDRIRHRSLFRNSSEFRSSSDSILFGRKPRESRGFFVGQDQRRKRYGSGRGGERAGFAGEALENGFAGGDFNEVEDGECKRDQDGVREPGVQCGQVKAFGHAVGVEELKDIEM